MWKWIVQPFMPARERKGLQHAALMLSLATTIPAFYLELAGTSEWHGTAGRALYALTTLGIAALLLADWRRRKDTPTFLRHDWIDMLIALGALASILGNPLHEWSTTEWAWRLALVAAIACRLAFGVLARFAPPRLLVIIGIGIVTMLLAGGGFYALEPTVHSFAEGVWLAFTSGATVGYGDLVPTSPASRIFAIFTVLIGVCLLSIATATIAATLIAADERTFQRDLHRDIRALREEVAALRQAILALRREERELRDRLTPDGATMDAET
jgi:voltage-gated potassium channel